MGAGGGCGPGASRCQAEIVPGAERGWLRDLEWESRAQPLCTFIASFQDSLRFL